MLLVMISIEYLTGRDLLIISNSRAETLERLSTYLLNLELRIHIGN